MPVCDLRLISLVPSTSTRVFLASLQQHDIRPIIQAKPLRWVILPTSLSTVPLLGHNHQWHLLLILTADTKFPAPVKSHIEAEWTVAAGVPSRLLQDFAQKNAQLLNPDPGSVKAPDHSKRVKAASSQSLELSPELESWIGSLPNQVRKHPISMLNLLAFNVGKKDQYLKYGKAFGERVGSRHGGNAKIVGNVIGGMAKEDGWDEIALAHYPSLEHFAAMLGSEDYQEVNHKYRLGALKDTFILCTMEIDDAGELIGGRSQAKI